MHAPGYKADSLASWIDYPEEFAREDPGEFFHIKTLLMNLDHYVNDFRAALFLFHGQFSSGSPSPHQQELFLRWKHIAARDAVITVYNFMQTYVAIKQNIHDQLPIISKTIPSAGHKEINGLIQANFPSFDKLRHGVAHPAEMLATRRGFQKNATKTPYEGLGLKISPGNYVGGHLSDNTFMCMHKGHERRIDITEEKMQKLELIRGKIFALF